MRSGAEAVWKPRSDENLGNRVCARAADGLNKPPYVSRIECPAAVRGASAARIGQRLSDRGAVVKRFGYALDPLCLVACGLYLANRLWLRAELGGEFLTGYFNDLLLIPAALPFLLWVQRRIGVRPHDARPRWGEIALHAGVWAIVAEGVMPFLAAHATGDWRDVVAYGTGAVAAGCWWQSGAGGA